MLPNARLVARAFHRVPCVVPQNANAYANASAIVVRRFSVSSTSRKWEGTKAEEHAVREKDGNNVQIDAVKEGKAERAKNVGGGGKEGEGSRATSEKGGEGVQGKVKEEFPEAPDPKIGMQDERGQKERK